MSHRDFDDGHIESITKRRGSEAKSTTVYCFSASHEHASTLIHTCHEGSCHRNQLFLIHPPQKRAILRDCLWATLIQRAKDINLWPGPASTSWATLCLWCYEYHSRTLKITSLESDLAHVAVLMVLTRRSVFNPQHMPYHGTLLLAIVPSLVSDSSQPRLLGSIPFYPSPVVLLPRCKVWKPQGDGIDERQMAEASPRQSKSVPYGASLTWEYSHKIKTSDDRCIVLICFPDS